MEDPLDNWLKRLPDESPAPDLAARIVTAVAQRRHARAMWQGLGFGMLACALLGAVLIWASWPQVAASVASALSAPETNDLTPLLNALRETPGETMVSWLDAGLAWQAAQADGIGAAFALGVALLAVAAFGGLAQAVRRRPITPGYSR